MEHKKFKIIENQLTNLEAELDDFKSDIKKKFEQLECDLSVIEDDANKTGKNIKKDFLTKFEDFKFYEYQQHVKEQKELTKEIQNQIEQIKFSIKLLKEKKN